MLYYVLCAFNLEQRHPHGLYETEWSDNFWMFQSCFVARAVEMQRLIRMEAICY